VPFLPAILSPVLRCLVDQDSRVRYYATEALYNSSKVLRGSLMPHFNEVFDVLCKLIADSDPSVQLGAHHVDRLMKDVVTECDEFDMDKFVPLLGCVAGLGFLGFVRQFFFFFASLFFVIADWRFFARRPGTPCPALFLLLLFFAYLFFFFFSLTCSPACAGAGPARAAVCHLVGLGARLCPAH
jgi:hypothetical protein